MNAAQSILLPLVVALFKLPLHQSPPVAPIDLGSVLSPENLVVLDGEISVVKDLVGADSLSEIGDLNHTRTLRPVWLTLAVVTVATCDERAGRSEATTRGV